MPSPYIHTYTLALFKMLAAMLNEIVLGWRVGTKIYRLYILHTSTIQYFDLIIKLGIINGDKREAQHNFMKIYSMNTYKPMDIIHILASNDEIV